MDYQLTPQQFQSALSQMTTYGTSPMEHVASAGLRTLIATRLTRPLGWISRHHEVLRTVLGLE